MSPSCAVGLILWLQLIKMTGFPGTLDIVGVSDNLSESLPAQAPKSSRRAGWHGMALP
jgi:hypothetical protein